MNPIEVAGPWLLVLGSCIVLGSCMVLGVWSLALRLLAFGTIAWLLHGIYMALGSWLPWSLTLAWSLALGFGSGYRFGRCYKYIYIFTFSKL